MTEPEVVDGRAQALAITRAQWEAMIAHVQAELPNEACGLLAGADGVVRRVYPVENILHSPREYELHPAEQVRVMLEIENAGWELSGIFHSHPRGPLAPSATDVKRAYYPESVYVILAPDGVGWRGRAFRLSAGRIEAVVLRVLED
jgi:proteasome lid subunit RPN8/RPN11